MNSLLSYGSDDDFDDSSDEKQTDWRSTPPPTKKMDNDGRGGKQLKQSDANYDEVQMDLSEESNDDSCRKSRERESKSTPCAASSSSSLNSDRRRNQRSGSNSRHRSRSSDRDRDRNNTRRSNRGDRYDKKYRSSGSYRDHHRSRRSTSRDRRSNRNDSRSPPPPSHKSSRSRSRSRSKSTDRDRSRRYEKVVNSNERLTNELPKPQIFLPQPQLQQQLLQQQQQIRTVTIPLLQPTTTTINKDDEKKDDRFFMPGITGRFRDQIERRKLLWQKKGGTNMAATVAAQPNTANVLGKKVWETTTFAQDSDGKVANKFKRLMGIRNASDTNGPGGDVLKKQEEMFNSMEQQYEVARTTTHTMRGVGLGFSSNYPR